MLLLRGLALSQTECVCPGEWCSVGCHFLHTLPGFVVVVFSLVLTINSYLVSFIHLLACIELKGTLCLNCISYHHIFFQFSKRQRRLLSKVLFPRSCYFFQLFCLFLLVFSRQHCGEPLMRCAHLPVLTQSVCPLCDRSSSDVVGERWVCM